METKPTYEELGKKVKLLDKKIRTFSKRAQTLQAANDERFRFEKLLTELSAAFVKVPSNRIDQKVEAVLRRIGEILKVDRTDFVQIVSETGQFRLTHSWTAKGIEPYNQIIMDAPYPWLSEKIRNGENYILFTRPDDLPQGAARDIQSLKEMGIKSGLIIPYAVEGSFLGAIAFGSHTHFRRSWPEEHIQRLKLM